MMSAMSESAEPESVQNASNSDFVENKVIIEANGDQNSDPNGVAIIGPDVDNCIESKTIECGDNSESERDFATTVMTRVTQLNGMNGMRSTDTDATQAPDVCSDSPHIDDGVDGMPEEPSQDSADQNTSESISKSDSEVIIIETVVKSESNEVTLITDTTVKTTINTSNNRSNGNSSECLTESNPKNTINNDLNKLNDKSDTMTTTTTSRPKQLKGLLKKVVKEKPVNTNGERKRRVRFSETMQVFCDDWPQNLMPQIIALKSPTDFNLVEVQGYMFEPPVEYQDFLPFDPPPDYRDFIANSLCAFDNDLSINYIDDEEDDDNTVQKSKSEQKFLNEFSSKWESMILNNNESLEEEQIIGVLKEDAILQAIGSHISLPEENLCPEDFPIHFSNNKTSELNVKLAESELCDITSDDGNESPSSPTGSLQDIQSDSSITSQDTIILINTDSNDNNNENFEIFSNKSIFNEINKNTEDMSRSTNDESVVNSQPESENRSSKSDQFNDITHKSIDGVNNECLNSEEQIEKNIECDSDKIGEDVLPDVTHNVDKKDEQFNEIRQSEANNERKPSEAELNCEDKQIHLFTNEESNDLRTNHSNSFRRNLQFYENMFSNNSTKSGDTSDGENLKKQSHRVSHFFIQNNPKYPIITQTVSNNSLNDNNVKQISESSVEIKQIPNEVSEKLSNVDTCPPIVPTRGQPQAAQQQQTSQNQPNSNNWSADELIIEYTSEPRALVPSKRTSSLSNFATAQMSNNPQIFRNNPNVNNNNNNNNNNNLQYLSLNKNGEIPNQWNNSYNNSSHNNPQVLYPNQNPPMIQRSLSPNPPMGSSSMRSVSPQPPPQVVYYQNRPQYPTGPPNRYPTTQSMPVHVMYNRMAGPQTVQQRVSLRLPIMSQTLGRPHKTPPPYHYHIQQHSNDFPNPSEIRRRDGLNAYPHVLNQMPTVGALPVPPVHHNNSSQSQSQPQNPMTHNMTKDELEQFVQQDIQRTERIKKRYSMTEEDDPSFGFARRPSVRGIRPKFESTTEILKQMQTPTNSGLGSQMAGSHISWPQNSYSNSNNNLSNNLVVGQQSQTLPKKPHIVQIRFQPQNPMSVKYMNECPETTQSSQGLHPAQQTAGQQMSRTLPRPSSLISQSQLNAIRSEDGFVIRLPANVSRDQLKQQIQRQIEQQFQSKAKQKTSSSSMPSNAKPMMSSNDERGAPEGASSSPKHSSDLLFAKNLSSNSNPNPNVKSNETTANIRQKTNDTKKLVINPDINTNSETKNENQSQGVIYYAMNV